MNENTLINHAREIIDLIWWLLFALELKLSIIRFALMFGLVAILNGRSGNDARSYFTILLCIVIGVNTARILLTKF